MQAWGFLLGKFSLFIIPILCHVVFWKAVKAVGNYRLNGTERQTFNKLNLKGIWCSRQWSEPLVVILTIAMIDHSNDPVFHHSSIFYLLIKVQLFNNKRNIDYTIQISYSIWQEIYNLSFHAFYGCVLYCLLLRYL